MSQVVYFVQSYFNSWISLQVSHKNFTVGREKVWEKHTSLCDTTLYFFKISWFPHQLSLLLSIPRTYLWSFVDLFHLSSMKLRDYLIMWYSIKCLSVVDEAQMYLFLYFQSVFNHSSKAAGCICCTFSLHTVPLLFLVSFCLWLTSWWFLKVFWWHDS